MADAKKVLEETILEADLLAGSGGTLPELQRLAKLTKDAYFSEDGNVPDERAQILHPSRWDGSA
jgi:hypothetical protein